MEKGTASNRCSDNTEQLDFKFAVCRTVCERRDGERFLAKGKAKRLQWLSDAATDLMLSDVAVPETTVIILVKKYILNMMATSDKCKIDRPSYRL